MKPKLRKDYLLDQIETIAKGLGETFAPFCEVIVHDLRDPKHAILAIYNNLSGRTVGDPATELGLARIADPHYPQVLSGYSNRFADGRQAKSTSIGIKNAKGQYVAALCLNVDLTLFSSLNNVLKQFIAVGEDKIAKESIDPAGADAIRARIDQFAARRTTAPRLLNPQSRRELMRELKDVGAHGHAQSSGDDCASSRGFPGDCVQRCEVIL